jgi:predicted phosphohydrolase
MRLVFISDTHTHRGLALPAGDVLVHAGDSTSTGTLPEVAAFLEWFSAQPHPHKIFIAGNHDWLFAREKGLAGMLIAEHPGIRYLQDAGCEIDGVRFWGSPWQPAFCDWAFNLPRRGDALREAWGRIPPGTDVLITHGPPHGILDRVRGGEPLGCEELRARVEVVKPRIHAFGHIHDAYGVALAGTRVFVNASTCDEAYRPVNRPIVVDVTAGGTEVQGIGAGPRKQGLLAAAAMLEAAERAPAAQRESGFQATLTLVADLRGMPAEAVAQDYLRRGLRGDLAQLERAESKPSRRVVPVTILEAP